MGSSFSISAKSGSEFTSVYEWLDGRLAPALEYQKRHPRATIAMLAEPGRGHFDASDELVAFLALFVRKAVEHRLPADWPREDAPVLTPVNPRDGWRVQRWRLDEPRKFAAAPFANYVGDTADGFWCFDEEMARATERHFADQIGKQPQLLGFVQRGVIVPQNATHHQVMLRFDSRCR